MKKILILAAAAAVLCSCANKNKYAVDGGLPDSVLRPLCDKYGLLI